MDIKKTIVLVGLMGCGKTTIGRTLAAKLGWPFIDADAEIEKAAGCSVRDIFDLYGERAFRDGERRVIKRLLKSPAHVLATGGGAFMDDSTRAVIADAGLSVWLKADLDLLVQRTAKSDRRPLLAQGNPAEILQSLMEKRYPVYAKADITVGVEDVSPEEMARKVEMAIKEFLQQE